MEVGRVQRGLFLNLYASLKDIIVLYYNVQIEQKCTEYTFKKNYCLFFLWEMRKFHLCSQLQQSLLVGEITKQHFNSTIFFSMVCYLPVSH